MYGYQWDLFGRDWSDPRTHDFPFADSDNIAWFLGNTTYSLSYLESHANCQPVNSKFQWGFSYMQLMIFILLLATWFSAVSILHLKAYGTLHAQGMTVPSGWKAIIQLADVLTEELQAAGIDYETLTEKELRDKIHKTLHGGAMALPHTPYAGDYSLRKDIWRRIKKDWFWLLICFIIIGAVIFSFLALAIPLNAAARIPFISLAVMGLVLAMKAGSGKESRAFLLLVVVLAMGLVGLPFFLGLYYRLRNSGYYIYY